MKKNKFAIFDIDGTIFRSSLLIELTEALIDEGVFPEEVRNTYARSYKNWSDRRDSYEKYINSVVAAFEKNIKGIDHKVFIKIAQRTVKINKNRVYIYTRNLLKELKKKNYYLIAISHSPREIVQEFCQELGFNKIYGRIYEVDKKNKFTGQTLYSDLIADKAKLLERALVKENLTLKASIGVGDSEGDISIMKMVANPICFNPNSKLYLQAQRSNWHVVVERKDVIYKI